MSSLPVSNLSISAIRNYFGGTDPSSLAEYRGGGVYFLRENSETQIRDAAGSQNVGITQALQKNTDTWGAGISGSTAVVISRSYADSVSTVSLGPSVNVAGISTNSVFNGVVVAHNYTGTTGAVTEVTGAAVTRQLQVTGDNGIQFRAICLSESIGTLVVGHRVNSSTGLREPILLQITGDSLTTGRIVTTAYAGISDANLEAVAVCNSGVTLATFVASRVTRGTGAAQALVTAYGDANFQRIWEQNLSPSTGTGLEPRGIAVSPDGAVVYVVGTCSSATGGFIIALQASSGQVMWRRSYTHPDSTVQFNSVVCTPSGDVLAAGIYTYNRTGPVLVCVSALGETRWFGRVDFGTDASCNTVWSDGSSVVIAATRNPSAALESSLLRLQSASLANLEDYNRHLTPSYTSISRVERFDGGINGTSYLRSDPLELWVSNNSVTTNSYYTPTVTVVSAPGYTAFNWDYTFSRCAHLDWTSLNGYDPISLSDFQGKGHQSPWYQEVYTQSGFGTGSYRQKLLLDWEASSRGVAWSLDSNDYYYSHSAYPYIISAHSETYNATKQVATAYYPTAAGGEQISDFVRCGDRGVAFVGQISSTGYPDVHGIITKTDYAFNNPNSWKRRLTGSLRLAFTQAVTRMVTQEAVGYVGISDVINVGGWVLDSVHNPILVQYQGSNGNLRYQKRLSVSGTIESMTLSALNDCYCLINCTSNYVLTKFDKSGNVLWSKLISVTPNGSRLVVSNARVFVCLTDQILSFDSSGNFLNSININLGIATYYKGIVHASVDAENNLIAAWSTVRYSGDTPIYTSVIIKLLQDGSSAPSVLGSVNITNASISHVAVAGNNQLYVDMFRSSAANRLTGFIPNFVTFPNCTWSISGTDVQITPGTASRITPSGVSYSSYALSVSNLGFTSETLTPNMSDTASATMTRSSIDYL